jgi:DNA-binding transcriptional MerR regulator
MPQKLTLEGTKIAQAAKDLNVTTVTIRRYVAEFNIKTATDENGIKVLPTKAMEELLAVRQLKEDGLSNAQVLDMLAEKRKSNAAGEADDMEKNEEITDNTLEIETNRRNSLTDNDESPEKTTIKSASKKISENTEEDTEDMKPAEGEEADDRQDKPKHTLTCQTCTKSFEHSNPRLRDCLDCYRAKRKERRRGGSKHKNVILHPLAQQAAANRAPVENGSAANDNQEELGLHSELTDSGNGKTGVLAHDTASDHRAAASANVPLGQRGTTGPVRNYRKAIDETRHITSSLKRRLERPDLPEGERRWLEQVYAYQLILHQGWRHLSEYKAAVSE